MFFRKKQKPIHTVTFGYLPNLPWQNGWNWAYGIPQTPTHCSPAANAPINGSIAIRPEGVYGLDYLIPNDIGELCNTLVFTAKFRAENDTMFFMEVELATADQSQWIKRWIKIYKGNKPSKQNLPHYSEEWTLWTKGKDLRNDWTTFAISLPDAIRETWGKQGWIFKSLKRIRIRGNISISPIEFYAANDETKNFPAKESQHHWTMTPSFVFIVATAILTGVLVWQDFHNHKIPTENSPAQKTNASRNVGSVSNSFQAATKNLQNSSNLPTQVFSNIISNSISEASNVRTNSASGIRRAHMPND